MQEAYVCSFVGTGSPFYNGDLFFAQAIKVLEEAINLAVSGVNLTLEPGLIVRALGRRQPLVQLEHPLDQSPRESGSECYFSVRETSPSIAVVHTPSSPTEL